ncbi:hypothetical protein [Pseudomonas sp.]|jgi:antitoxin component YwqK of YwqJK toxin-antitoxin module|uniref:hypothetical protein n=1 Tax=Pseudomonas sp. TaxID=306 RepID=UPI002E344D9F|nr:hypothetical protein [Pseudomonas sp.]HEX4550303.1 hypothetical protein [Pseudomonas sp.]
MVLKEAMQKIIAKYGNAPAETLNEHTPTGQKPLELFITDEHTENYLSLKTGPDQNRGLLSGLLGGVSALIALIIGVWMALLGKWDGVAWMLILGIPLFIVPIVIEARRALPLPVIFNRRTKEVYFDNDGELYHTPWRGIEAVACEFEIVGIYSGNIRHASLEVLMKRLGEPENSIMVSLGTPAGKSLNMQKGFWEYIRSYMNNGPWFDHNGEHSESDEFVKSQLALNLKQSENLSAWRKIIQNKKEASAGKNFLTGTDALMLISNIIFYPSNKIQEFVYERAKRRSRNRWPEIVTERLRSDGPTTRLIDLERKRGLSV